MLNVSKSLLPIFTICHPLAFILIGFCFLISMVNLVEFHQREVIDTCLQEGGLVMTYFPKLWTNGTLQTHFCFCCSSRSLFRWAWRCPQVLQPQTRTLRIHVPGPGTAGCWDCAALQCFRSCSSMSGNPAPSVSTDLWDLQVKLSPSSRGARLLPSVLGRFISFRNGREYF